MRSISEGDRRTILCCDLGRTGFAESWGLQRRLFELRSAGRIPDVLLLTEHHPVYTFGKTGDANHLLVGEEELKRRGISLYFIDRGGDVTYHGPGQLVGYPILNLAEHVPDLHAYLRDLEEVIIRALADFGIRASRDPGYTGVWVNGDKIAAIGVKVSRWITMHGFALNINNDLDYFNSIIPCGIFHKGVTSVERTLGRKMSTGDVAARIVHHFGDVFSRVIVRRTRDDLMVSDQLTSVENR